MHIQLEVRAVVLWYFIQANLSLGGLFYYVCLVDVCVSPSVSFSLFSGAVANSFLDARLFTHLLIYTDMGGGI